MGVKVFTADIIYHLFDAFTRHMNEKKKEKRAALSSKGVAVFPVVLSIIPVSVPYPHLCYAHVCSRMLTYAHVCSHMLTHAHVCSSMLTCADLCSRMQGNVYNKKNPIIVGVDVVEGTLKVCVCLTAPLCMLY